MQGRELLERRTKMLTLKSQGVPLKTIINDFVSEYAVSKQALYKDWRTRKKWASDVAQLNDPALLDELIQGLKQIIPNAWYEYKTNPNPSVKLGALKLAKETYLNLIEIGQSTGQIERVPEKAEVKGKIIVELWHPDDDSNTGES